MSRIAILQMNSNANVSNNLSTLELLIRSAVKKKAKLAVLPENFAYLSGLKGSVLTVAEFENKGSIQSFVSQLAKKYKIWIVAGTIPLHSPVDQRVFSACIVYNDKGESCARYDKIHLFDVRVSDQEIHKESDTFLAGKQIVCIDTPVGCIGLSICYDIRFPELYRKLLNAGAQIFILPAAFTATTGAAHWEVLLRARAIENTSYMIAANQCGTHDNSRVTWGHSMAVDPWGAVLTQSAYEPDVLYADIDLKQLASLRSSFPCNKHHVLD